MLSLRSKLPFGFTDPPNGFTEIVFSETGPNLRPPAVGAPNRRLELRPPENDPGSSATQQPFFAVSLNIPRLADNANGAGANGTNVWYDDFVFEILVDRYCDFSADDLRFPPGAAGDPVVDRDLTVTVRDSSNTPVGGVPVRFALPAGTAPRLTIVGGDAPDMRTRTVQTQASGATAGQATVTVRRAAGAGVPAGVTGGVLITVTPPTADAGGENEYDQEYFVPTSIP